MSTLIVKLTHRGESWYLPWSTVSDGPLARGMDLAGIKRWWRRRFGTYGAEKLPELLRLVEASGVSVAEHWHETADSIISTNCAGPGGKRLSKRALIMEWCK